MSTSDIQRIGRVVRALRRRRAWRQVDLARRAGVSQGLVSLVERGHGRTATVRALERILATVDASLAVDARWRGGALDRLLDERHAELSDLVAATLRAAAWVIQAEVSHSHFGERGSIDLVGWLVCRLLVLPNDSTPRRWVERHSAVLMAAMPLRGVALRRWLRDPRPIDGRPIVGGLWFVSVRIGVVVCQDMADHNVFAVLPRARGVRHVRIGMLTDAAGTGGSRLPLQGFV